MGSVSPLVYLFREKYPWIEWRGQWLVELHSLNILRMSENTLNVIPKKKKDRIESIEFTVVGWSGKGYLGSISGKASSWIQPKHWVNFENNEKRGIWVSSRLQVAHGHVAAETRSVYTSAKVELQQSISTCDLMAWKTERSSFPVEDHEWSVWKHTWHETTNTRN